jgi:hypothetical protein
VPGAPLPSVRTQLEDELAGIGRPSRDGYSPTAERASADAAPVYAAPVGPIAPDAQAAFQPGACPEGETYLMQCNAVGRVTRKALEEGCMVSVQFNNLSKHRKKMAPIRSAGLFNAAALSDAGTQPLCRAAHHSAMLLLAEPCKKAFKGSAPSVDGNSSITCGSAQHTLLQVWR